MSNAVEVTAGPVPVPSLRVVPDGPAIDVVGAEAAVRALLRSLGQDPETEHLRDTPRRVALAYEEFLTARPFVPTTFPNDEGYDELVLVRDIPFHSLCQHHLLPFSGVAHVGYLPGARILGLSKLARVVEHFAHGLQVQERLTKEIGDWLDEGGGRGDGGGAPLHDTAGRAGGRLPHCHLVAARPGQGRRPHPRRVPRPDRHPLVTITAPRQATPGLAALAAAKAAAGVRVSVCIPARNEAATVAGVVAPLVDATRGPEPLVDEVIVVDDCSTDATGTIAGALGARVAPRHVRPGKGAAMAEALRIASGDIVVFADADVRNFGLHFVTALIEPLLDDPSLVMVKGTYQRAGNDGAGGGRVTELLARPLLRRLVPDLAFVRQPLAGEVAVRRGALEGLALEPGYGVEIGMLIDIARRFGAGAVAQVDLGERVHRNRPLDELAGQADEVLAAVLVRTVVEDSHPG
jgi:glucosyl-3-phosphoglycerate synthase